VTRVDDLLAVDDRKIPRSCLPDFDVGFWKSYYAVEILGGNQGDSVSRAAFPKEGKKGTFNYKLVAYRWPTEPA
jgi:hypothetical protein